MIEGRQMMKASIPTYRPLRKRAPGSTRPRVPIAIVWMLAIIGAAVAAGHLVLVLRHLTAAQFGIASICWMAVMILVREDWRQREWSSSISASLLGLLMLAIAWSNALWMTDTERQFLFLFPLLGATALALLASGFGGLRQYWRELTILFFLGVPRGYISEWIDLSPMTAKLAAFALWYGGRDVQLIGTEIVLAGGSVNVDKSCDGTGVISYLLCLGIVFIFLFPVRGAQRVLALIAAPVLAFITNMIRVLTLALMEAAGRHDAFEYWHDGSGSIVWTLLPVLLFGMVALCLLPKRLPVETPGTMVPT
jgi:cyanoexosortase A